MPSTPVSVSWDGTDVVFSDAAGGVLYRIKSSNLGAIKASSVSIGAEGSEVAMTLTPTQANLLVTTANAIRTYLADGMLQIGTLAITVNTAKFKTTTTLIYTIAGLPYTTATTDDLVFSAADTINVTPDPGDFWGAWLVEIGVDGNFHTKPAGGLADQAYASEAAAIAALPAVTAAHVQVGYITVEANTNAAWTANTDDLTGVTDCQAANFYDLPAAKTLPAAIA